MISAARAPVLYLVAALFLAVLLMGALAAANYCLAPLAYSASAVARVAETLVAGRNEAVFDLNLTSREWRRQQIARLAPRPMIVLGASHWQEAHADLLPGRRFYNAHVHRDYYEDLLAVAEMLIRHDRLPGTMIISIRDLTFLPVDRAHRHALADRAAGLRRHGGAPRHRARDPWLETRPGRRWLGLLSLPTMCRQRAPPAERGILPGPVAGPLAADHGRAAGRRLDPLVGCAPSPSSRPNGRDARSRARSPQRRGPDARRSTRRRCTAVDRLLGLLRARGVRLVLIHPPFNPDVLPAGRGSPYGAGLRRVEALTARLAAAHGATVVGSFDPAVAGCTEGMYIDAEHSSPACLARVLHQVPGL